MVGVGRAALPQLVEVVDRADDARPHLGEKADVARIAVDLGESVADVFRRVGGRRREHVAGMERHADGDLRMTGGRDVELVADGRRCEAEAIRGAALGRYLAFTEMVDQRALLDARRTDGL